MLSALPRPSRVVRLLTLVAFLTLLLAPHPTLIRAAVPFPTSVTLEFTADCVPDNAQLQIVPGTTVFFDNHCLASALPEIYLRVDGLGTTDNYQSFMMDIPVLTTGVYSFSTPGELDYTCVTSDVVTKGQVLVCADAANGGCISAGAA